MKKFIPWKETVIVNQSSSLQRIWTDAQIKWHKEEGKPYYNVSNEIIGDILRADLNLIYDNKLEVPGNFQAINIRLEESSKLEFELNDNTYNIYSIFFAYHKDIFLIAFMYGNYFNLLQNISLDKDIVKENTLRVMAMEFQKKDISIKEQLNQLLTNENPFGVFNVAFEICLKLITTLKFLVDVPDEHLMEYDVAEKYQTEYCHTKSDKRKEKLRELSFQQGNKGWNIGTNHLFLEDHYEPNSKHHNSTGRELTNAHIRRGHVHIVRYGVGREKIQVKYFRAVVVRPDLPFKDGN